MDTLLLVHFSISMWCISQLVFTADERDRIDYIFYYPAERLSVKDAVIFGPEGSICKSQRIKETSKDRFITPLAVWPTDHKGLLVTFGLTANSGR